MENPSQFGVVVTEGDHVKEIIEKPENPQSDLVNAGLYYLEPSVFQVEIEKSSRGEYEFTDYIKKLLERESLFFVVTENWTPISSPESLQKAEEKISTSG